MIDNELNLFLVEFSHRLYKKGIDKTNKNHFWQHQSLMICCKDISDVEKEIIKIVDETYRDFVYNSKSSQSYKCSSDIKIISIESIK